MTILQCLKDLPDDMQFIDLTVSAETVKTVKQIREENEFDSGTGYYKEELSFDYGQRKIISIRCKYGGVYNQV